MNENSIEQKFENNTGTHSNVNLQISNIIKFKLIKLNIIDI